MFSDQIKKLLNPNYKPETKEKIPKSYKELQDKIPEIEQKRREDQYKVNPIKNYHL